MEFCTLSYINNPVVCTEERQMYSWVQKKHGGELLCTRANSLIVSIRFFCVHWSVQYILLWT